MQPKRPTLRPKILLAKSMDDPWKATYGLTGHTAAVVEAVITIINELGDGLIQQFALSRSLEDLKATAQLAAFLHDLGKANDHFQAMVRKLKNPMVHPQLMRHEALSLLLAWEMRDWLSTGEGDFYVAIAAAGGHHLKMGGESGLRTDEVGKIRSPGVDKWTRGNCLWLYTKHMHFKGLLKYGQKICGLDQDCP